MRKTPRQFSTPLNKLFLMIFFLFFSAAAFSQTITGTITDSDNKPIGNATIQVKGSSRFTQSDNAGKFSINASGNDALIFTSVGFASQEIPLNGRRSLAVKMNVAV